MRSTYRLAGLAAALFALASCNDSLEPRQVFLHAEGPSSLQGTVAHALIDRPAVKATDQAGAPIGGVPVRFVAADGAGSVTGSQVLTGDDGIARSGAWTLGTKSGVQSLLADSPGRAPQGVVFVALVSAGPPEQVEVRDGDAQTGDVGVEVRKPLSVVVRDAYGNGVSEAVVSFAGDGIVDAATPTTDASGLASAGWWRLGATVGIQHMRASIAAGFVEFTATGTAVCATSCRPGPFAFVRDSDIFVADDAGGNQVNLTNTGGSSDPAWSPDGRRIAFSRSRGGFTDVLVMNANGARTRVVATNAGSPSWSADGNYLVVTTLDRGLRLGRVSVDGAQVTGTPVGFNSGYNAWPAWSPDGARIAFVADWEAFDFALELYVAKADGSAPAVQVTDGFFGSYASWPAFTIYSQPAWSPDGSMFALVTCGEWQFYSCDQSALTVMNVDGTAARKLVDTRGFARPAWSPDGKTIGFSRSCLSISCTPDIYTIDVDGTGERKLIANGHSLAWRPR